ncbi:MAG: DUF1653 domain-containing protein [Hyphomonadaceae bacterium]|nr:DUF1653 domain-containing protein [Clostridia bacterium]
MANEPAKKQIEKGTYRHFKGNLYEVMDTVIHSESLETFVLYKPIAGDAMWVRPYDMFFEMVEHNGEMVMRFERV